MVTWCACSWQGSCDGTLALVSWLTRSRPHRCNLPAIDRRHLAGLFGIEEQATWLAFPPGEAVCAVGPGARWRCECAKVWELTEAMAWSEA